MNENLINNTKIEYKRNCPKCGTEIVYRGKRPKEYLKTAEKRNSVCSSCSQIGLKHPNIDPNTYRRGKDHWNYGNNMSNESVEKMRKSLTGKRLAKEHVEKISKSNRGKKRSASFRESQRQNAITAMEKRGMLFRGYNKDACGYFENLNKERGWNLQHAENGGEIEIIGYFPDAYDKDRNIVVEYDEPHHYNADGILREKDIIRMNEIIQKTGCTFYRYNEKRNTLTSNTLTIHEPITIMM